MVDDVCVVLCVGLVEGETRSPIDSLQDGKEKSVESSASAEVLANETSVAESAAVSQATQESKEESKKDAVTSEETSQKAQSKPQEEAEPSASKPVRKTPEYVSLYNQAKSEFNSEKYEEALVHFDQAIEASPSSNPQMKTLIYSRASCLKKLNRLDESIAAYSKCIELDPKYTRAYKARGSLYQSQHELEEAIRDFSFAYLLDTVNAGDIQPTSDSFDTVIQELADRHAKEEVDRRSTSDFHFSLPSKQFLSFYFSTFLSEKSTQYNTVGLTEEECTERITHHSSVDALTLGDLYLIRGGIRKARAAYVDAYDDFCAASEEANHCSDLRHALLEKATFVYLSGDARRALPLFSSLVEQGMSEVNLHVKYASCLLELEDDRNKAIFDEAVDRFPQECDAWFHRGQMRLIGGDVDGAKEDLLHVVQMNKSHAMAYVHLAFAFAQEQRFDSAIDNMKHAVACGKVHAAVWVHYGELLNMMSCITEAESKFRKAVEVDPQWPYSYVNLAMVELQARNDYLKAFEYLDKATKIDGSCVTAFLQKAQLHMLMQENDAAKEELKKALEQCRALTDLKQVCGMEISLQFQVEALEKYQKIIKAEGHSDVC